jgi:hypothetical protein
MQCHVDVDGNMATRIFCKLVVCFICFLYVMYASVCVNLSIFIVMFMYSYSYVCNILCILFHCVVLCTVCV